MDFSLTEEQLILGRSARQFLEAECPAAVVREAETTEQGHVPELWGKMADLGWLGMSLPEIYGGTGGSLTDQVVLFEEIGRALVPGPLLVSSVLASQIVLNAGNDS
ncbi:MAG: acyl-CoA dehydrogenase family protein, partial [Chloroflexota bacterium]|nr:acyl-CoA dehydrogenase family protein [Chloroflexota bacterium]